MANKTPNVYLLTFDYYVGDPRAYEDLWQRLGEVVTFPGNEAKYGLMRHLWGREFRCGLSYLAFSELTAIRGATKLLARRFREIGIRHTSRLERRLEIRCYEFSWLKLHARNRLSGYQATVRLNGTVQRIGKYLYQEPPNLHSFWWSDEKHTPETAGRVFLNHESCRRSINADEQKRLVRLLVMKG